MQGLFFSHDAAQVAHANAANVTTLNLTVDPITHIFSQEVLPLVEGKFTVNYINSYDIFQAKC